MRRRAALSLIASCLVAACAHQTTPQAMPGMAWLLSNSEGEGAKLAFGEPQSDNVVVMLTCEPRSGQVRVSANAAAPASALQLRSKRHALRVPGETGPSGLGEGAIVEGVADARSPVFDSFAETGELTVGVGARSTPLPAGDRTQIRRFVEACRSA